MRPGQVFAVLGALGVLAPGLSSADPHAYVEAGLGDFVALCVNYTLVVQDYQGMGGVCMAGGHVQPGGGGIAVLSIADSTQNPTSAFYCQDADGNGLCGTGELSEPFCGSHVLDANNWDPALAIIVRVHGVVYGSPLFSPCPPPAQGGLKSPTFGTTGTVTHTG